MYLRRYAVILAILMFAMQAGAASFRSLPLESKADMGATHVAVISYTDLTSTNLAGGSQIISNLCVTAAKQSVEMVAMVLTTPFVDNATNAHNSTTLAVGDIASSTVYLPSTELNSNGSAVYLKLPAGPSITTATTNISGAACITNITLTTGMSSKLYTSANNLYFTFTGTSLYPMSALDAGEVRIYFRIKDAAKANP